MQLVLADPGLPEDTRILARQLVAQLRGVEQGRLPGVADMLSETADQMYQGSYAFGEGTANQIFRWVKGKGLVAGTMDGQEVPVVSKPQAAQYWGARSARKALELKPGDPVARRALLGLSIENEVTRQRAAGKPFQPIGQSQPALLELLAGQDSPTLNLMLRQALKQDRQALALALLVPAETRPAVWSVETPARPMSCHWNRVSRGFDLPQHGRLPGYPSRHQHGLLRGW
jgi:hypothetical protein